MRNEWHGVTMDKDGRTYVKFRNELSSTRKRHPRHQQNPIIHPLILSDALPKRPSLIINRKSRDLLDELKQVDSGIEERGFELRLGVGIEVLDGGFERGDVAGDVDQGDDVDGELAEDGEDDVGVKDVGVGALFAEFFDGLLVGC